MANGDGTSARNEVVSGSRIWIHGPLVDIALLGLGWLPIYVFYLWVRLDWGHLFSCDVSAMSECPSDILAMVGFAMSVTAVHRQYSLVLVYGNRSEFQRRPRTYVWAPVLLALFIYPCVFYSKVPRAYGSLRDTLYAGYVVLLAVSGLWNIYHLIRQKYGFMRIYAAKLGYGDATLDQRLLFSWIGLVAVGSAASYSRAFFGYVRVWGLKWLLPLEPHVGTVGLILVVPALLATLWITLRWVRTEWANYRPDGLPRVLFVASVALSMAPFCHSLLAGALTLGFSHAFEYCVFATVYVYGKYRRSEETTVLARLGRHPVLFNFAIIGFISAIFAILRAGNFAYFIVAYGFHSELLHFLYDGYLWRVRDPAVRSAVIALGPLRPAMGQYPGPS